VDWIRLAPHQDKRQAVVSKIVGLGITQNAGSFMFGRGAVSFSRRALLQGVRWKLASCYDSPIEYVPSPFPQF
jgi:hypothetical protein